MTNLPYCMLNAPAELQPVVNHVFVDFENVHHVALAAIGGKDIRLTLLLGARQTKLDVALVEMLLQHAASVELVSLASSGKNALDFTLAYYVGLAVAADPKGIFHIVSADTGYDPLIEHLRSKRIQAHRHVSFDTLPFAGSAKLPDAPRPSTPAPRMVLSAPEANFTALDEPTRRVHEHLRTHLNNRPKRKATLLRHLITVLGGKATEADVMPVVESLCRDGFLAIDLKGAVTYRL